MSNIHEYRETDTRNIGIGCFYRPWATGATDVRALAPIKNY